MDAKSGGARRMTNPNLIPARAARTTQRSVIAVGVLFLVLGALDLYRGVAPLLASAPRWQMGGDDVMVLAIGVAAIVGGIYVMRGANWARWLLAVWMALHVAISIGEPRALLGHVVIFGFVAYLLFNSRASVHFAVGPKA
jgi:hypothetical protein